MTPWIPDDAPTLTNLLLPAQGPFPTLPMLAAVLAIAYLLGGVVRLRRQRRRWPLWRTVCFLLGCLVLAATTGGVGVEAYGYALLSVFMFQQLTLMMTVPPLLILGSPGTLLLRATPHHGGVGLVMLRTAHAGLRHPPAARWALSPG